MSLWLDLGGDHFHGSPELSQYAALFIRKTAKYRLQAPPVPLGKDTVPCLPVKLEDGWLTDPDLYHPQHAPAAYRDYTGDKRQALWHYDRELAQANSRHHGNLGHHQCLSNPVCTWRDDGDGWTFQAKAEFLDAMPDKYGGRVANQKIGHSRQPFLYRCKITEPVEQVGRDTFRAPAAGQVGQYRRRASGGRPVPRDEPLGQHQLPAGQGRRANHRLPGGARSGGPGPCRAPEGQGQFRLADLLRGGLRAGRREGWDGRGFGVAEPGSVAHRVPDHGVDERIFLCGWSASATSKFDVTDDAWHKDSPAENPIAFLRLYSADFELRFSTLLPGIVPFEIVKIGPNRYAITAQGRAARRAAQGRAGRGTSPAKTDGYLLILDFVPEQK